MWPTDRPKDGWTKRGIKSRSKQLKILIMITIPPYYISRVKGCSQLLLCEAPNNPSLSDQSWPHWPNHCLNNLIWPHPPNPSLSDLFQPDQPNLCIHGLNLASATYPSRANLIPASRTYASLTNLVPASDLSSDQTRMKNSLRQDS